MKLDQRSKGQRVRAVQKMAKARGRKVTQAAARLGVAARNGFPGLLMVLNDQTLWIA